MAARYGVAVCLGVWLAVAATAGSPTPAWGSLVAGVFKLLNRVRTFVADFLLGLIADLTVSCTRLAPASGVGIRALKC